MYVCMYACIYICICMYIYTYMCKHNNSSNTIHTNLLPFYQWYCITMHSNPLQLCRVKHIWQLLTQQESSLSYETVRCLQEPFYCKFHKKLNTKVVCSQQDDSYCKHLSLSSVRNKNNRKITLLYCTLDHVQT